MSPTGAPPRTDSSRDYRTMGLLIQIAVAFLAGVGTAFQPGVNTRFAEAAGARIHGGVINFAVGLVTMLLVWLVSGTNVPPARPLAQGPWWMWTGGVLGAFFVTTAVFLTPKLGTAGYLTAMIAGQLITSLLIDQFGLMGLKVVPVSMGKVLGAVLIFAGMLCVKFL